MKLKFEFFLAIVKKLTDAVESATRSHSKDMRISTADAVSILSIITNLSLKVVDKSSSKSDSTIVAADGGKFR